MRRVGPFARNDLPHRVAYRRQDSTELGVFLADDIETTQPTKQSLPHAGSDLVGLQDNIEERPALHRQRPVPGPKCSKVEKSKLAFVAGSAFADGRAVMLTRHSEPRLRRALVTFGIIRALKPDAHGRFGASLSRTASGTGTQQRAVGGSPEFEIIPKLRAGGVVFMYRLCARQPISTNRDLDCFQYS